MRSLVVLSVVTAAVIGGFWAFLGRPVAMPDNPIGQGDKLYCISYAPFRHGQTPFDLSTRITPEQIEDDITRLARLTDCVRTYSVDFGLDRIAEVAGRHGMTVIQGLWLSSHADRNRYQIETTVALAQKYPKVIRAIVVGNEVLLRGELSAQDLATIIRSVKARVPVPVTYADVWEFWLRNPQLAAAVDFVTVHILPYWEDDPIPATTAAAHVDSIHRRVAQAFPGKGILIGEFGWPSAGRMREGALPSQVNQARVIQGVLALARREHFNVNVIEAWDQPWKRLLEGTVGGYWGLFDATTRQQKFSWGAPVSEHPYWPWQALGGILFAALILFCGRGVTSGGLAIAVTSIAVVGGCTIGWAFETLPRQSLGAGGALRSLALAAVAVLAPPLCARALTGMHALPRMSHVLGDGTVLGRPARALGAVLIAVTILAVMIALGLAFDPRYRDFPFAPLSAAVVPLAMLGMLRNGSGARGLAEIMAATILAACAVFIAVDEGLANWQSLWFCGLIGLLAITLARLRGGQS